MLKLTQIDFEKLYQGGHHDFSNMKFEDIYIENKDLSDCNFEKSSFAHCTFHDVYGSNVNFSSATFVNSSFDRFDLSSVRFDNADFHGRFQSGTFRVLSCESCNFYPPYAVSNSTFSNMVIEKGNFEDCNMRDLHILECSLKDIQIEDCSCQGLHVYVERLDSYENNHVFDTVYFKNCELQNAAIRALMSQCIFNEVDASSASWQGSRLISCDIRSSKLSNANLQDCTLNADFFDVQAQKADFTNANIYGCKIQESNLESSNFMKVNLRRMTFSNTILDHVDFAGAEMNGAYFNNVHTIDIKNLSSVSLTMGGATREEVKNYERNVLNILKKDVEGAEKERSREISFDLEGNAHIEVKLQTLQDTERVKEVLQNTLDTEMENSGQISDTSRQIVQSTGYSLDKGKVVVAPTAPVPTRNENGKSITKLSASIVKKINIMKKEGFPVRICPNGQVYMDPNHLRYFKRDELREISDYYENKVGKTFKPNQEQQHSLPDSLKKKIHLLEQSSGDKLKMKPDGRVIIPLMQLRYFKNEEISALCSYFMNQVQELEKQTQRKYPQFSGKINKKLEYLEEKGMPLRICPNGQAFIPESELKYFKSEELQEINRHYAKEAEKNFKADCTITQLPMSLKEKLKNMEINTGKKLVVSSSGKATLPPELLQNFTDEEISTLNSYCINRTAAQKREKATESNVKELPEP